MSEFNRKQELKHYLLWLAIGISLALCLQANHVHLGALLDREGVKSASDMLRGLLRPNVSPDFLRRVLQLSFESLFVGLLGTVFSLIIGTSLALVAMRVPELPDPPARRLTWQSLLGGFFRWTARFFLGCFRSIPEIVWAYAFVRILGLGPGAAVLAIGLTVGGSIGKLFAELGEAVDPKIIGGLRSAGLSRSAIILHGILPQVRKQWVAYALFRLECNIRTGTILGVVGAGGLGSEIALSIRYFEFDKLATTLLAVLVFVIALEMLSAALRRASVKWSLSLAVIGGLVSFYYLDIPWADLFSGNFPGLTSPEKFTVSLPYLGHVTVLMFRTVLMAWAATILAAVVAFFAAPLATKMLVTGSYLRDTYARLGSSRVLRRVLLMSAKLSLQIARAMPELTLALLFVVWVGPGAFAGILAIAVHNIGVISRLYTDVYEEVEPGPAKGLEACGSGPIAVWLFGVLPQVVSRLVAFTLYRFEVNLRATITVGFVGAGGAGDALNNAIALFHMGDLTVLLAVMLVFVTAIDYAGDRLRQRILRGPSGSRLQRKASGANASSHQILELPAAPAIAGPNILYRIGAKREYTLARMVELSPSGMTLACGGRCPYGLVLHWFAFCPGTEKPVRGLAKVVGLLAGEKQTCRDRLQVEFIQPTSLQMDGLKDIALRHGVQLNEWEQTTGRWDALEAEAASAEAI